MSVPDTEVAFECPPPQSNDLISNETAIMEGESIIGPSGDSANAAPLPVVSVPHTPMSHLAREVASAAQGVAVCAALSRLESIPSPIPALTPANVFSAEPVDPPAVEPIALHSASASQPSTWPLHDAPLEVSLGRHWYLVTKGLQTGVFLSWETTSPLVTGVLRAIYYHIPNAVSGWIRYGHALQAGNVEVIIL
ncbi:hypothetical protein BS47DRAFT_1369299 [Hydnum rufescens UP504]|uniref:Uncharacterized protein n=1 Tax=Hydnum rufescens UP504 TaxID=1448309 RepID=A0A9P6AD57_9AGAM|nr:hypothetical protein BS47DRAFT_1369299 [Hydnum rufescens UP504]